MYDSFAVCYDELMSDYDYSAWADFIESRISGRTGVDLACGTGNVTLELAGRGYKMTGADLSPQMLSIASAKAAKAGVKALFLRQDITSFLSNCKYDFAIIACDGLNYVKDFSACFKSVAAALVNGGSFIFDISTPHKLESVVAGNTFFIERDNCACVWQNSMRSGKIDMELTFFIKGGGGYTKSRESQTMYIHSEAEIERALHSAGFEICFVAGDDYKKAKEKSQRKHFVCRLL